MKKIIVSLVFAISTISFLSFADEIDKSQIDFSSAEQKWLKDNPVITLSVDDTYPPMNFRNENGEMDGITIDYMRLLEARMGVKFQFAGTKWNAALASAMEHRTDGILNADALESRKAYLNFSDVYATYSQALVVKEGLDIKSFKDCRGKIIAVKRDTSHLETVKTNVIGVIIYEVDTVLEGLKLVLEGKADAVFDDLVVINHRILKNFYGGLKVAFVHKAPPVGESRIGLRNSDPVLLQVFNKAVASLSEDDHKKIQAKWIGNLAEGKFDHVLFWRVVALFVVVGVVIIAWNLSLRYEKAKLEKIIASRTKEMINMEKMRSMAGLAAGIAHEINNPLGVIIQSSQNILRRTSPDLEANKKCAEKYGLSLDAMNQYFKERSIDDFLISIEKAGDRAAGIVMNMLGFGRESAKELVVTDVEDMLEHSIELASSDYDLARQYDFRKIKIFREYGKNLPKVEVSSSAIEQVFFNLLKNSAHAMCEHGTAVSPKIRLTLLNDNKYVTVIIEDNGPGMTDECIKHAFEPFYTTKKAGKGTGLGLFVAYSIIVDEHKGRIAINNLNPFGLSIKIDLPIHKNGE